MPTRTPLSRRCLLTAGFSAAALAAFSSGSRASGNKQRSRPHILWLVSEDNNPFIGAYGDRIAHTPAGEVMDSHADPRIRLQALNALTFIGQPARQVLDVIERAMETSPDEYIRQASRYLSLVLRGNYTPESPIYQGRAARTA